MEKAKQRIATLEQTMASNGFWNDRAAANAIVEELGSLKSLVARWERFREALEGEREQLAAIEALVKEAGNEESPEVQEMIAERAEVIERLERDIASAELSTFLQGPYDTYPATLSVMAGAGGRDAADWAAMLLRMFTRYAEQQGWKVRILHDHKDPDGGVKSATVEISGKDAYGWLRREGGVHRLVRISPFDASKRRHTSFAMVEVLPVLPEAKLEEIEIKPEEVHIEMARSSGPGGQNVNRRETAVRITHLPTGLVAACQAERTQGANRERAMAILKTKLLALRERERRETIERERATARRGSSSSNGRGDRMEATWSNQMRSYILHPYKLVKDHRTNVEHHNPEAVLDGELDRFIEAEVKLQ